MQTFAAAAKRKKPMISLDDFKKLDIRVGTIRAAEPISGADKLLRLEVDLGGDPSTSLPAGQAGTSAMSSVPNGPGRETRQLVAGIARQYEPHALVGTQVIVLANLEPRILRGVESQGMLLAADANGEPVLLRPERETPPGSVVK